MQWPRAQSMPCSSLNKRRVQSIIIKHSGLTKAWCCCLAWQRMRSWQEPNKKEKKLQWLQWCLAVESSRINLLHQKRMQRSRLRSHCHWDFGFLRLNPVAYNIKAVYVGKQTKIFSLKINSVISIFFFWFIYRFYVWGLDPRVLACIQIQ